jgi:hypothetical protein
MSRVEPSLRRQAVLHVPMHTDSVRWACWLHLYSSIWVNARWFSFRHRLKMCLIFTSRVSETSLRDSTELSPFIHRDYGFFSIWGQDRYWFNGPFALWSVGDKIGKCGMVCEQHGIMFFQSAGSIVAFLHLMMNSILGDSNNEMCLTREYNPYCTAYKTHYIPPPNQRLLWLHRSPRWSLWHAGIWWLSTANLVKAGAHRLRCLI